MKKIHYRICIILFLLISILLSIIILSGCETQQEKEDKLAKEKMEEIEIYNELLEILYRNDAVLLAFKYKVNEEKVFNILVNENEILYKSEEELEDIFSGKNLNKRIKGYEEKYNIPTNIVASILIDYILLSLLQDINDYEMMQLDYYEWKKD